MRVGLYGGTFDPVHRGHIEPARYALDALGLDRILFLPTAAPPHKPPPRLSAIRRFTLVELALLDEPALHVSELEMTPGVRYTIDTVEAFRAERPADEPTLLVGADAFASLPAWHRWRDLIGAVRFGIFARPAGETAAEHDASADLHPALEELLASGAARAIDNPPVEGASRDIRRWLAESGPNDPRLESVLPPRVLDYVRKYSLYGDASAASGASHLPQRPDSRTRNW